MLTICQVQHCDPPPVIPRQYVITRKQEFQISQWLNRVLLVWTLILHISFNSCSVYQTNETRCMSLQWDDISEKESNITYLLTMLPYPQPEGINKASFQPAWAEGPAVLPAAELISSWPHQSGPKHVAFHSEADKHWWYMAVL